MGSTVTIYLDLVKGGVAPNSAAKPKRRAAHHRRLASNVANDEDDSGRVFESPTLLRRDDDEDDAFDAANANRRRTRGNVQSSFLRDDSGTLPGQTLEETRLREELDSLREETRLASARAREAEDALAAAEIRREAESAEDRARDEETERLERELAVTKTLLTEAKYKERQAVTKATNVTSELCDARTELTRLRASTQTLETRMKLERDLSDRNGAALGAAELASKFGEGSGLDPRVAVETLCRALAGKNRQMYAQMEEYAKLTKSLRAAERARKSAEARAASVLANRADDATGFGNDDEWTNGLTATATREPTFGSVGNPKGGKRARTEKNRDADTNAFASRVSRGWGREDGAYDDDLEDAVLVGGPSSSSFPSAFSSKGLENQANAKDGPLSRKTARGVKTPHDLRGGGPLSRVPAAAKKHNQKKSRGKSGEDLLDDILESVDAENAENSRAKKRDTRGGFDLASLASRRSRLGAADENDYVDLNADLNDAGGSGGGGGSFIIHGADGRGGRAKIFANRPGGGPSQALQVRASSGGAGASGSLDRFLTREKT